MKKAFLCLSLVSLAGCGFSRRVVNEHIRDFDTAWIRPGVTKRAEVIARLGPPPATREGGGVRQDVFGYLVDDDFSSRLEVGYFVTPTFERGRAHHAEDILIKFAADDTVELLSRTRSRDGESVELVEWKELPR